MYHSTIPVLDMSDPGPSFREKCLLASRLVFQATDQYSAAVVFAYSPPDLKCCLDLPAWIYERAVHEFWRESS